MTFAAAGQFGYFLSSLLFGVVLGAVKGFFPFRGWITLFTDLLFWAVAAILFVFWRHAGGFPDARPYMALAVFSGFFAVRKISSELVAKARGKWYNGKKAASAAKSDRFPPHAEKEQ